MDFGLKPIVESCLHNARWVALIDGGQRYKSSGIVVGQGTGLVEGNSVSAGCAESEVLDLVDPP